MDDQIVGPASRVVDIWNDDGVWAVLDEGCNSTVCGSEWMERAVEAYAAVGYEVVKISDETKPFNQGFVWSHQNPWQLPHPSCSHLCQQKSEIA